MEWCIYNHVYYSKVAKGHLLYSSLSNRIVKLDNNGYETIMEIISDPDSVDPADDNFKFLFEGRFLVASNETEINKQKLSALTKRFNPELLSLTIAPTRACNFACPYCYECDRANKSMKQEVKDEIINFVKRHEHIKNLGVVWYGGEPTLEIDAIKYLSKELQKIIPNYSAFMVTNAYLSDKIAEYVDDLKISALQITLDGTKETHNQTRCLKNGLGTFDKILQNIDILLGKSKTVRISVRMNISTENSEGYVELSKLLKERYPERVNLYPAFVHNYGGNCQADFCYDDGVKKAIFLKNIFVKNGLYTKDMYPIRSNKGCMVQMVNAYVIGPEGELYKCWHHLGVSEKIVGNIFSSKVITDYGVLADIMLKNDSISDDKCLKCVLFPSCDGGCTDNRETDNDYCIPAKYMLEEMIDSRYIIKNSNKYQTKK